MGIFSRVKRGFKEAGKYMGEGRFSAGGKQIKCSVCGGEIFDRGRAQLNTSMATFLNFDWANRTAENLVCKQCTHVLWFMEKPERVVE